MVKVTGGDRLGPVLKARADSSGNATTVQTGFFPGATYPDGTSVAMVAAIQNYGAPRAGIPPRPFFRDMIKKGQADWPRQLAGILKAADFDAETSLRRMGALLEGQLRQSIIETNAPPLSPVTLMLRQMVGPNGRVTSYKQVTEARARVAAGQRATGVSEKPLVWTGQLLGSITSEVT